MTLPTGAAERKAVPIYSGFIRYFPDAIAAVAELSRIGNDQHNPGQPLHWDRSKSGDERDALSRHLIEAGTIDSDGVRHSTKLAWRAMANLQKELEGSLNLDAAGLDDSELALTFGPLPVHDEPDSADQDKDGWIEWKGFRCAPPIHGRVVYKCRNGNMGQGIADLLDWSLAGDIIAYRVMP